MSLHARSDVMSVTVPVANGGCGLPHSRPVINGAPVKDWILDCVPCESFLKRDIINSGYKKIRLSNGSKEDLRDRWPGLWGATEDTTPQTYGEETESDAKLRKQAEAAATANEAALTTIAQAMASNTELTGQLLALVTKSGAGMITTSEFAEAEHNAWDSRACRDCGATITRAEGQKGMLPHRCPACRARSARKVPA